jgi:lipopolysaccharide transport system ATP-binding protein
VDQEALQAEPGSIHTAKVQLLFARFLDSDFNEKLIFNCGEDVIISVGFRVRQALAEPHVGFKIRDNLGRVIFETSSLCMHQRPVAVYEDEIFAGNFRLRLSLAEGEYSLVVGFSEGAIGDRHYREALFFVQDVKTFTVVPGPKDIVWSGIAHLHPKFGWSILKEKPAR